MRAAVALLTAATALTIGARMLDDAAIPSLSAAVGDEAASVTPTADRLIVLSDGSGGPPRANRISWFAQSTNDGRWTWFVQNADSTESAYRTLFWPRQVTRSLRQGTLGPITTGSYDSFITTWARYFRGLRDPVRLRALPDLSPSIAKHASSSKLVRRARARIRAIFRSEGVVNVRWLRTSPSMGHS
jgi:hypothetical protein